MSRPRTGNLRERRRADGTILYTARVMAYGNREHVVLGDERDGMTRLMAKRALRELVRDIELGVWVPPAEVAGSRSDATEPAEPTFAEAAAKFIEAKRLKGLEDSSMEALHWALDVHLVPFFGHLPPVGIDEQGVADYVAEEVARRDQIEALRERGQKLVGPRGGAMRGMSNQSINSSLRVLHNVLAWAVKRGWGDLAANPAASIRLKERKRPTFPLEVDELADLITATGTPRPARRQDAAVIARAALIVRLRDEERRPWQVVAERAGVAETTAIYHYQQAKEQTRFACDEERAAADEMFVMALAWTGARVSELCSLNVENVDLGHAKLRIPDSKTEAGIRSVDMTKALVERVATYFALRGEMAPTDPAFPDANGRRRDRNSVNQQLLKPAVRLANEQRLARGANRLPRVSAHVLRHTYITHAFEAGYSVPYVKEQVGHRDAKMTLEIYAKVAARRDRSAHGDAFDRLMASGRSEKPAPADKGGQLRLID